MFCARSVRVAAVSLTIVSLTLGPAATSALAWGRMGHRLTARVAELHLTPNAAKAVSDLLDDGDDLLDASTWPDEHKTSRDAPWHFVNVPISESRFDSRFCASSGCVVSKIKEFQGILKDKTKTKEQRLRALRFLTHLVGDLHQPLHVGDDHDRGGTLLQVKFFSRSMNLHKVWDSGLIEKVSTDELEWMDDLEARDSAARRAAALRGSVEDWANESHSLAKSAYLVPGSTTKLSNGDRVSAAYFGAHVPAVRDQLYKGGVRLAKLINEALDH